MIENQIYPVTVISTLEISDTYFMHVVNYSDFLSVIELEKVFSGCILRFLKKSSTSVYFIVLLYGMQERADNNCGLSFTRGVDVLLSYSPRIK